MGRRSDALLRRARPLLVAACLIAGAGAAQGHALHATPVADGEPVTLRFSFPGAESPVGSVYRIHAPGAADTTFQTGQLNALGEVSVRPDRTGTWRVVVTTRDGHSREATFSVDDAGTVAHHSHGHWARAGSALGYLFGAFGLVMLWRQWRRAAG